jgi:transposase InsO family protein
MEICHERCCGLDVHQKTIVACFLASGAKGHVVKEIRTFSTMTPDILALADGLTAQGCTHIAMESTGVYWKPIYNLLEGSFELLVANAHHLKSVPGRKTDVRDAEWIADLLRPVKRPVRQTTNSQHPWPRYPNLVLNRQVTQPDEVWVADITYIKLQTEFVYLAVVMDLFTRTIRGWQLSRWLDQSLTLEALQRALAQHEPPQIHHSDQGVQYAARAYVEQVLAFQIKISMAEVGAAWQNGYAERIIRTIKEEEIDLADYQDFADAYAQIGHFVEQVYQHKRIHSALGYLTPAEFEANWRQQHQLPSLTIM